MTTILNIFRKLPIRDQYEIAELYIEDNFSNSWWYGNDFTVNDNGTIYVDCNKTILINIFNI